MSGKIKVRRPSEEEVLLPASFELALWVARAMSVAPTRLRRTRAGWHLSVSPHAKLQRLIVILNCIAFAILTTYLLVKYDKLNIATISFANLLIGAELCLVMIIYLLGVWESRGKTKLLMNLLRQMQKINSSIYSASFKNSSKGKNKLITVYILWLVMSQIVDFLLELTKQIMNNELDLIYIGFYQFLIYYISIGSLIRLIMSTTLFELTTSMTILNDQLECLLTNTNPFLKDVKLKLYPKELEPQKDKISACSKQDFRPFEDDIGGLQHINQCHGAICDIVNEMERLNGLFLFFSLMLLFIELLVVPESLLRGFESGTVYVQHTTNLINRIFINFCDLLIIVESCQRLRDQMDRTRSLLGRLMGQDQRCGFDPDQLELFIIQAQLRDAVLAPFGVITIGRPLVFSMIGGVVTFLVITIQFDNAS